MSKVLSTRLVGRTTHVSGHPMAPMDYVYEVEPARPRIRLTWVERIACIAGLSGYALIPILLIERFLFR